MISCIYSLSNTGAIVCSLQSLQRIWRFLMFPNTHFSVHYNDCETIGRNSKVRSTKQLCWVKKFCQLQKIYLHFLELATSIDQTSYTFLNINSEGWRCCTRSWLRPMEGSCVVGQNIFQTGWCIITSQLPNTT